MINAPSIQYGTIKQGEGGGGGDLLEGWVRLKTLGGIGMYPKALFLSILSKELSVGKLPGGYPYIGPM